MEMHYTENEEICTCQEKMKSNLLWKNPYHKSLFICSYEIIICGIPDKQEVKCIIWSSYGRDKINQVERDVCVLNVDNVDSGIL